MTKLAPPRSGDPGLRRAFEELRAKEFSRLDESGYVYLDYTGSALYAESHLRDHEDFLEHHVLGNPHSENPASAAATRIVEETRRDVLDFFGADPSDFAAIFTANASAALKLVGEGYPFGPGSRFTLLEDAHNSVNGIRAYADRRGAETTYLPLDEELRRDGSVAIPPAGDGPSLFSFPAQSNFSGVRHPLSLAEDAHALGYDVLLDAAAFVPTSSLDLGAMPVDFACVSFYKMFGFPTGVGALLARREALARLERPWFAGGTVDFVSVGNRIHRLALGAAGFEDGTLNFLGIAALQSGLAFLREVGMERVRSRVGDLTTRLLEILGGVRHANGAPAVRLYGPTDGVDRGGTASFNLLDAEGHIVPYGDVERAAGLEGIALRGGCFCNPGAAERALELPDDQMLECLEAIPPGSFSLRSLAECLGGDIAVGALRASVSIPTTDGDLDRLEAFLRDTTR
ncbi:MAG: aminotransferase class V-fold PLP-dependent enzyme [Gemmatimonadota bacterium]|nr:aminotransferase class V-fold PLP-dependent enzyme [Gemmatimonadota bacterium]MDH3424760.1 aminotransferase class V-fold PLP-dependent enzyme [Gemmatimonadota bacterium]